MIRDYIHLPHHLERHLRTQISPYLDGYASMLKKLGYTSGVIRHELNGSTAFGEYLMSLGKLLPAVANQDIDGFVKWYQSRPNPCGPKRKTPDGCHGLLQSKRACVRKLLRYLRSIGITPPAVKELPIIPYAPLLREYLDFLVIHRGCAAGTVDLHRYWGEAFLRKLAERSPAIQLDALDSETVESAVAEFVILRPGTSSSLTASNVMGSFVRHLRTCGHIPQTCRPFLLRQRRYALAALPSTLEWKQVEKMLSSINRTSVQGSRDYAICLLFATYGLRASEVVGLKIDDFDWRGGSFRASQIKTRRVLHLPLVRSVVEALVAYLAMQPSKDIARHVFQRINAPRGPLTSDATYRIVRKALLGAGIKAPQYGSRLLRHTRATSLIRKGQTLKVVGDLLGHRHPDSTLIYCKLAVDDLRGVALELPEVQP